MKKYEAIGVVETQYFTYAMELLDKMCKTSNVEFLTSEKELGGRLVSVIVGGKVSDVTAAVQTAKEVCEKKEKNPLKMAVVITNPHQEILKFIIPKEQLEKEITLEEKRDDSIKVKTTKQRNKIKNKSEDE